MSLASPKGPTNKGVSKKDDIPISVSQAGKLWKVGKLNWQIASDFWQCLYTLSLTKKRVRPLFFNSLVERSKLDKLAGLWFFGTAKSCQQTTTASNNNTRLFGTEPLTTQHEYIAMLNKLRTK